MRQESSESAPERRTALYKKREINNKVRPKGKYAARRVSTQGNNNNNNNNNSYIALYPVKKKKKKKKDFAALYIINIK